MKLNGIGYISTDGGDYIVLGEAGEGNYLTVCSQHKTLDEALSAALSSYCGCRSIVKLAEVEGVE